jgi:hypothetical protein
MKTAAKAIGHLLIIVVISCTGHAQQTSATTDKSGEPDIRKLSQHFITPGGDLSPWIFVPQSNVQSLSTTERPGILVIHHAGHGEDIKGILKDPIRIDDYPLPWEFHLGFGQIKSSEMPVGKSNFAMGLNIALTFSDPSTWPKDRTQMPPDTHTFQLLTTRIMGPQIKDGPLNYYDGRKELQLLYGRGDLSPEVTGNWNVPYVTTYDRAGGPASFLQEYRLKLDSPTQLEVGFFGGLVGYPHPGWKMKTIDVSRFGKITGIWEIGPIISGDRWIPDTLAPALGIDATPPIAPPDPLFPYFLDYATFFGTGLPNMEQMSDDFDVPGYQAKWYHEGSATVDTYSHPGYMTVTLMPFTLDGWAMCPSSTGPEVTLSQEKNFRGYEVETSFIPPDGGIPWHLFFSGVDAWEWEPGVRYFPKEKRHRFINMWQRLPDGMDRENRSIGYPSSDKVPHVEFEKEVPEKILGHRPLFMLVQIVDSSHLRVGFKANKSDRWYMSKPFDTTKTFGKIEKVNPFPCIASLPTWGWTGDLPAQKGFGIGNYPQYPQFLFKYVHFRWGLSQ